MAVYGRSRGWAQAQPVAPPGGGALWRGNEPAGMTTHTDRPYNAKDELSWSDFWPDPAGVFITTDASAPKSPSNVLRCFYGATRTDSSAPGAWDPPLLGGKRTAYICTYIKHSANWQGHNTGTNKVFYFHALTNDDPVFYFTAEGVGAADLIPYIALQGTVNPVDSNHGPNLVPGAVMPRNQWNLVEVVAVGNTAGNQDGSVDWYLNGDHVGSFPVQFQTGDCTWQRPSCAPVWGGNSGDIVTNDMTLDWDHTYFSWKN